MPLSRRLAALRRSKRFAAYMKARKANRFAETWYPTKPKDADPVAVANRIRKARGGKPDPLARFTDADDAPRRRFSGDYVVRRIGRVKGFDVVVELTYDNYAAGEACSTANRHRGELHVEPYGDFVKGSSLTRAEQARAACIGEEVERDSIFRGAWVYFVGGKDYGNDFASLYEYARAAGMAKGPAFLAAQRETKEAGDRAWNIVKGEASFYIVTATASIDGTELGHASVGGCEYDDPDACFADHAADMVAEAVHEAESNAAKVARRAKRRA